MPEAAQPEAERLAVAQPEAALLVVARQRAVLVVARLLAVERQPERLAVPSVQPSQREHRPQTRAKKRHSQ